MQWHVGVFHSPNYLLCTIRHASKPECRTCCHCIHFHLLRFLWVSILFVYIIKPIDWFIFQHRILTFVDIVPSWNPSVSYPSQRIYDIKFHRVCRLDLQPICQPDCPPKYCLEVLCMKFWRLCSICVTNALYDLRLCTVAGSPSNWHSVISLSWKREVSPLKKLLLCLMALTLRNVLPYKLQVEHKTFGSMTVKISRKRHEFLICQRASKYGLITGGVLWARCVCICRLWTISIRMYEAPASHNSTDDYVAVQTLQ